MNKPRKPFIIKPSMTIEQVLKGCETLTPEQFRKKWGEPAIQAMHEKVSYFDSTKDYPDFETEKEMFDFHRMIEEFGRSMRLEAEAERALADSLNVRTFLKN